MPCIQDGSNRTSAAQWLCPQQWLSLNYNKRFSSSRFSKRCQHGQVVYKREDAQAFLAAYEAFNMGIQRACSSQHAHNGCQSLQDAEQIGRL